MNILAQQQRYPFSRKLKMDSTEWFKKYKVLSQNQQYHALLESGRGGRYSIAGLSPVAVIQGQDDQLAISKNKKTYIKQGNPLERLREYLNNFNSQHHPELPDFQGGAIGYFNYDAIRYIENIPNLAKKDIDMPDIYFLLFDDVFVFDHEEQMLWIITHDEKHNERNANKHLDQLEKQWVQASEAHMDDSDIYQSEHHAVEFSLTDEEFMDAVKKTQEYIRNGDVFQVNLSVRQTQCLKTHPFHIYEKLRDLNPSPYMSYLQFPEFQVISGSPELLVKKKGDELSTRPIAGTRSRGKDFEDDQRLADELVNDEKERAEHVMLVDLERNDLGRVCQYGTVHVDEFMVIEKYSHVMHIVSNVKGILDQQYDTIDVVKAVFPGGTITGAPKIRTMEIIEELEPVRRGLYTGSIGWIGFQDDMELNIVIRTMIAKDGKAHVQAGAGIVIDSDPEAEYKECLKKAKALWRAKELSEKEIKEKVELR